MWRALERIPETYREPLVLFYRQHHAIERVAERLDISEDTARQRRSRGRKLLQVEVTAFIERGAPPIGPECRLCSRRARRAAAHRRTRPRHLYRESIWTQ
jgi:hypothetical protein